MEAPTTKAEWWDNLNRAWPDIADVLKQGITIDTACKELADFLQDTGLGEAGETYSVKEGKVTMTGYRIKPTTVQEINAAIDAMTVDELRSFVFDRMCEENIQHQLGEECE